MFSAKRSLNFVLSKWSNRQPNQWVGEQVIATIVDGQAQYLCPSGTVAILDMWVRNYQMGEADDITPNVSTTNGDDEVTITWTDHGLVADQWISISTPVAIGGLVLFGFYQVVSVPSTSTFTISAGSNATSTTSGGTVPAYATTASDETVTVTLAAHGYVAGETWTVHQQVSVGGIVLLGDYVIVSTPTANTLTFEAASAAGSNDTESENDGEMEIAAAGEDALAQDRMLTPISRTEWAMIGSKSATAAQPTSYFFDRQKNPVINLWPVPAITAPMELRYFRLRQMHDANPQNTETPDIPYRAQEAFCSALAAHLAVKWKPEKLEVLKLEAADAWREFAGEDRERVPLKIQPQIGGYYK
jgi:hypothetical protein